MKTVIVYGDGVHDDTKALQLMANGKAKGICPDGSIFPKPGTVCRITRTIEIKA